MQTIYQKAESILRYNITAFLVEYEDFLAGGASALYSYYEKDNFDYPAEAFEELDILKEYLTQINEAINKNKSILNRYAAFFELVDLFEEITVKLETFSNLDRWLNSSAKKGSRASGEFRTYNLAEKESIESAAITTGYADGNVGGMEILMSNKTRETDWSLDGGYLFRFNYKDISRTISLKTVIGALSGEEVLGRDIYRVITFTPDDLMCLVPRETFPQTCKILLELKRGDNPEFPYDGIDKTMLVNRVIAATTFPIVMRQVTSVIFKDDTIRYFTLDKVDYVQDGLYYECSFYTQLSNKPVSLSNK